MIKIRSITLTLLLLSLNVFAQDALVPGQTYNTGNIVQPTVTGTNTTPWVNGVYQNSLTCWTWGDPGYCGPNPIVRPGNNINFSYGMTNLYQIQSVASVLPNSGTGLRVDGYNFGFVAKNGNGWDNGQTDYLNAYVTFYSPKGSVAFNKNYNLNYNFDWTSFNFSETFTTPFATKDLGTVQYGFVGGDSNYWAGPYGPEIYNINFSLKYSIDPCFTNVLSSPTCPGYLEELTKLITVPTIQTTEVSSTTTTPTGTVTTTVIADSISPTVTVSTTPDRVSSLSSSTTSSTPNSGLSIGLSVIAKNKEKEQEIVSQAVQLSINTATSAAGDSQKEALSIASESNQASQASSSSKPQIVSSISSTPKTQENREVKTNQTTVTTYTPTSNTNSLDVFKNLYTTRTELPQTSAALSFSLLPENRTTTVFTPPVQKVEEFKPSYTFSNSNSILATTEVSVSSSQSFLTDRTNPINQAIENKIQLPETNVGRVGPSVNRSVSNNEVAGGVDINRMALAPNGYDVYLTLTMRDAAFYEPKEIYKNQKTIDNVRALRQLASDRLHREMVEQQYSPR